MVRDNSLQKSTVIYFNSSPFVFRLHLQDLQLTQICSHNKPNHNMAIKLSQQKIAQQRSKNKWTL